MQKRTYVSEKFSKLRKKNQTSLITRDSSDAEGCSSKPPEISLRVGLLLFITFPFVSPNCPGAIPEATNLNTLRKIYLQLTGGQP